MFKKTVWTLAGASLLLAAGWSQAADANVSLTDIAAHWSKDAVSAAVEKGYVDGYPDGTFLPDKSVTRAEFIKMLAEALKLKHDAGTGDWYQPYVNSTVATGIHRYEDFTQDINGAITRQEMTRLIVRATDNRLQSSEVQMDDKSFVYNAAKKGLIQGLTGGELGLDQATTRAQAVTVIERVLSANGGGQLDVDKAALQRAEVALTGTNFETVIGRKSAVKLPAEYALTGNGVKVRIDEIYLVDTSDPTSPYLPIIEGAERFDYKSLEENYVFIFKVHYELGSTSERTSVIRVPDFFQMTSWLSVDKKGTTYDVIRQADTGSRDSYLAFAIDKWEGDAGVLISPSYLINKIYLPLFVKQ